LRLGGSRPDDPRMQTIASRMEQLPRK
jgi:hypothetical protein